MRKDMMIWHTISMLGAFESEYTKPTTKPTTKQTTSVAIAAIGLSDDEKIARAEAKRQRRAQRNQQLKRVWHDGDRTA